MAKIHRFRAADHQNLYLEPPLRYGLLIVDPKTFNVRRATLEDLHSLKGIWDIARLPSLELEKRLTDFQVVSRADGVLTGCLGLRMASGQGHLHSMAFYTPEGERDCLPLLWERMQTLARNHGLARLWVKGQVPFWTTAGFHPPDDKDLGRLPKEFGDPTATWLTLSFRDENLMPDVVAQEFELFQMQQRETAEKLAKQARLMKLLVALIAVGFLIAAALMVMILLKKGANLQR